MGILTITKLVIFTATSAGIVYLSWGALRSFRRHGFYRFFAWELILVLALMNLESWFANAFAPHQIISWVLLIVALGWVIPGFLALNKRGKPDGNRDEEGLLCLEKTTRLVTDGVYRYIRHPLYSSLLFLAWGIFFKSPSWLEGGMALGVTLFLWLTAKAEEVENERFFGPAYQEYARQTRRFIPFLF